MAAASMVYRCQQCGGDRVYAAAYVNLNPPFDVMSAGLEDTYCNDCCTAVAVDTQPNEGNTNVASDTTEVHQG
jgi:hypothetical protein